MQSSGRVSRNKSHKKNWDEESVLGKKSKSKSTRHRSDARNDSDDYFRAFERE